MKKIAIQGHPTRGKEVIQILESLGGENPCEYFGDGRHSYYFINCDGTIDKTLRHDLITHKYYTLEGFEKEFPFKIGDKVIINGDDIGIIEKLIPEHISAYCVKINNVSVWCVPAVLRPYKEMNTRNITLTLDKAKEWYKQGGDLKEVALQAFTEQELNPLPRNWNEFCKMHPTIQAKYVFASDCPQKYIALWKLEQLRNCYRQGWKPDWVDYDTTKYCITITSNEALVLSRTTMALFLSFQSKEVAEEFLKNFDHLIKEAGDLI